MPEHCNRKSCVVFPVRLDQAQKASVINRLFEQLLLAKGFCPLRAL